MYFSIKKVVSPYFGAVIWPDKAQKLYIRSLSHPPSDYLRQKNENSSCLIWNFGYKLQITSLPYIHFTKINWKSTPCLIDNTEYLPQFIVKYKITCLPASWLSIALSDTDLMFQFRSPEDCKTIEKSVKYTGMALFERHLCNLISGIDCT